MGAGTGREYHHPLDSEFNIEPEEDSVDMEVRVHPSPTTTSRILF